METSLKYIGILAIIMAVNAMANFPYDTKFIEEINKIVLIEKSNTVVILVVKEEIIFVSTEGNAPKELRKHRKTVKDISLEIVKADFEPLNTNDVVEKLGEIGETRHTFLVYFTACDPSISGTITIEEEKPVGLLGKLLETLGINLNEEGLIPIVLSVLGIGTTVTNVTEIEFNSKDIHTCT